MNDRAEKATNNLIDIGEAIEVAHYGSGGSTHPNVIKYLDKAYGKLATAGHQHSAGDFVGASENMRQAAEHMTVSAKQLASEGSQNPLVLGAAHMGLAHKYHQDYVDAINEGKRNGS